MERLVLSYLGSVCYSLDFDLWACTKNDEEPRNYSYLKSSPAQGHERSRHGRWMNQTRALQTWRDVVVGVG